MYIKIFSAGIAREKELEEAANKFMARTGEIEVIDVVFDQKIVPGSMEHHDAYYGQSVIMVKYRTISGKPLPPEDTG